MRIIHFKPSEFTRNDTEWYNWVDTSLIVRLDVTREFWGNPIHISQHPRAVGRHDKASTSFHNVDRHKAVLAVDVFPVGLTSADAVGAFQSLAVRIGFSGIGYYPDWKQGNLRGGFHLDVGNRVARWVG